MHALEVKIDGVTLALAGTPNASMLTVSVFTSIEVPGAQFDIIGMDDLGGERRAHTRWTMLESLNPGARLEVRLVETGTPTPPVDEIATDAPAYIAEQAWYERQLKDNPVVPRPLQPVWPRASYALTANGQRTVAILESGRELLFCRFLWDAWRPDGCRVSLRSSSTDEVLTRAPGRQWFSGRIGLGEDCALDIGS